MTGVMEFICANVKLVHRLRHSLTEQQKDEIRNRREEELKEMIQKDLLFRARIGPIHPYVENHVFANIKIPVHTMPHPLWFVSEYFQDDIEQGLSDAPLDELFEYFSGLFQVSFFNPMIQPTILYRWKEMIKIKTNFYYIFLITCSICFGIMFNSFKESNISFARILR